ncbi:unnamed protein product [Cunninghamella blakesleeana]
MINQLILLFESLQRKFFETNQPPSATVTRKAPPSFSTSGKKQSLFAQRRAAAATVTTTTKAKTILDLAQEPEYLKFNMPSLESSTQSQFEAADIPSLETTSMPSLENTKNIPSLEKNNKNETLDDLEYEPVMDPHPEPYSPAVKKMLDLTSMLGSVLGEIKEHNVENVMAPSLPVQQEGFPQPKHRSKFKQSRMKSTTSTLKENNEIVTTTTTSLETKGIEKENDQRISMMTDEEINEAREEILSTLSHESILFLQNMKNKKSLQKPASSEDDRLQIKLNKDNIQHKSDNNNNNNNMINNINNTTKDDNDDETDLLKMKEKFFADVPMESDKLAWMDDRFKLLDDSNNNNNKTNNEITEDEIKLDPIYRQLRFDLQGKVVDQTGYTLAELFYLVRSQVPSQRALVLNCLTKILETAKKDKTNSQNQAIIHVFRRRDVAATLYIRSALDDRHLVVIISAINALLSLITIDDDNDNIDFMDDDKNKDNLLKFNTCFGHIAQPTPLVNKSKPVIKEWVKQFKGNHNDTETDDAELAENDLVEALLKMDLLARFHYLMAMDSELRTADRSMNQLLEILIILAKTKGMEVCENIVESNLLELAFSLIDDDSLSITSSSSSIQKLYVFRLLFTVLQGSKKVALALRDKITTLTLPWLAISPVHHNEYLAQIECIKILRILACYGIVLPTLQDLQETIMEWLRVTINDISSSSSKNNSFDHIHRVATVIQLLEILLHAAADPHRTVPAHAIDWHQPTAYLPLIIVLLNKIEEASASSTHVMLHGSCLGYIATWLSYIEKFPHDISTSLQEIWHILQVQKSTIPVALEASEATHYPKERSSHWILRYMQIWIYFMNIDKLKTIKDASLSSWVNPTQIHEEASTYFKSLHYLVQSATKQNDIYGRMVYYLWYKNNTIENKNKPFCFEDDVMVGTLVSSLYAGVVETWLTQEFVQLCVLSHLDDKLTDTLKPFYMKSMDKQSIHLSKSLLSINGKDISTLCYPIHHQSINYLTHPSVLSLSSSDLFSIWLLSPIDELFYWDKSQVVQHFILQQQQKPHGSSTTFNNNNNNRDDALEEHLNDEEEKQQLLLIKTTTINIVITSLQVIWNIYKKKIDHPLLLVTLMKLFLIGDREGQSVQSNKNQYVGSEIFWDEKVTEWIIRWLDEIENNNNITGLICLENAWQQSSEYIRKAHASFYPFYQSFLSQYASVSFGYPTYSRLLAFVADKLMDQIDYKHLLLSDYHDVMIGLERQGYHLLNK